MKKLSERKISVLIGCLIGIVIFILIYGIDYINVQNDKWLINIGSDLSCSYIGWEYYRKSSWNFPIGLADGMSFPDSISITYTGAIPVASVICKFLSSMLPDTFQYLGIWGLLTYVLQGAFASILLYDIVGSKLFSILGTVFFVLSTPMIGRMYAQDGLAFHVLILIAIWFFCRREILWNRKSQIWLWALMMSLAVSVHMYLMPMVFCFAFFFYVDEALVKKNWNKLFKICIPIVVTLLTMYILGDFYGTPKYDGLNFGEYNSKLNAFFIPAHTSTIKIILGIEETYRSDWEGYAYLGAGVIILLVMVLLSIIKKRRFAIFKDRTVIFLGVISVLFLLIATEPSFSVGNYTFLTLEFPKSIEKILAIFRANGRFMWPIMYIIMLACFKYVSLNWRKAGILIVFLCLILQLFDLSLYIKGKKEYVKELSYMPPVLESEVWDQISNRHEVFFFVDENSTETLTSKYSIKTIMGFADYAFKNNMVINDFYYARKNVDRINERRRLEMNALLKGEVDSNKIYIFPENPLYLEKVDEIFLFEIDGVYVGIKNEQ